jgi:hypothetical protein
MRAVGEQMLLNLMLHFAVSDLKLEKKHGRDLVQIFWMAME